MSLHLQRLRFHAALGRLHTFRSELGNSVVLRQRAPGGAALALVHWAYPNLSFSDVLVACETQLEAKPPCLATHFANGAPGSAAQGNGSSYRHSDAFNILLVRNHGNGTRNVFLRCTVFFHWGVNGQKHNKFFSKIENHKPKSNGHLIPTDLVYRCTVYLG